MTTNLKIKSIQKGWGEQSKWFRTGDAPLYKAIREELKTISWGNGRTAEMIVYRVYDHNDGLVVELEPNSALSIYYQYIK